MNISKQDASNGVIDCMQLSKNGGANIVQRGYEKIAM